MLRGSSLLPVLACAAFILNGFAASAAPIAAEPAPTQEQPCHTVNGTGTPVPAAPADSGHDCCMSACHCAIVHLPVVVQPGAVAHAAPILLTSTSSPQIALRTPKLPEPIRPPIA